MSWNVGNWCWHTRYAVVCQIVDRQSMWGKITYRVWLPDKDAVVRAIEAELSSLDSILPSLDQVLFTAAAAKLLDRKSVV